MKTTSIEWVRNPDGSQGYTWNPITGCLNGCEYCYARMLANGRLKQRYLSNKNIATGSFQAPHGRPVEPFKDPFYPRFWSDRIMQPWPPKGKPKGYFVCDMSDLFGIGVPEKWTAKVMRTIEACENDRFYLLTKQPQNLAKWSPFPNNCWVGATCTSRRDINHTLPYLMKIAAGEVYLSLEPLLTWDDGSAPITSSRLLDAGIKWIIIGAQTKPKKMPELEWVKEIINAADNAGIPVFLKDNLYKLLMERPVDDHDLYWEDMSTLRQELPGRRLEHSANILQGGRN